MKRLSIKSKIIVFTLTCVILVSLLGNLILFGYLRGVIEKQSDVINSLHISTITSQLETYISKGLDLGVQCASDAQIVRVMNAEGPYSNATIGVQNKLGTYLNTYLGSPYVNKLVVFNKSGMIVQAANQQLQGLSRDFADITSLPLFSALDPDTNKFQYLVGMVPSMSTLHTQKDKQAIGIVCQAQRTSTATRRIYIYIELNLELFNVVLSPYINTTNVFMATKDSQFITSLPTILPADFSLADIGEDNIAKIQGKKYRFEQASLPYAGLSVYLFYPVFAGWKDNLTYPLLLVLLMSLLIASILSVIISHYISRPIERLKKRLKGVAENDFSFAPEIEATQDEMGMMGRTINEMTLSISQLLSETKQMYETRKNIELSLLQSQVNPHFLYNTLDTIRWMAVIQKNNGIEQTVLRLINLLKNLSKGTQDKISLREEIALLQDYIEIQNIRYMEMFAFVNEVPDEFLNYKIVKFTLQPLIENAIFHGIEPAERWGTITLSAKIIAADMLITIEDDGVGIPEEKLAALLYTSQKMPSSGLSGIGVANVHQRLKLVYGSAYGLDIDSETGERAFTKITVHIPIEN